MAVYYYFASLSDFYLAAWRILSEQIFIPMPIANTIVPIIVLNKFDEEIFFSLTLPCKKPLPKVKIKALIAISKGTLVVVLSDKG